MFWRPWAQTRPAALAAGDATREAPLEKRSGLRRLVIGAGLSGLFAALLAAQAGEQVTLVYLGVGGLPLSPGTIDVFAGEDLPDEHPYRLIGAGRVAAAVRHLAELVPELLAGDPASNVSLPTALGTLRPTCLAPQSMLAGADLSTPTVIVGFTQLKDFSAARTAGALQAATSAPVRHLVLDLPPRQGEIDANAVKYARAFDKPAFQELFAEKLRPLLRPGEKVGLPAVLGLRPGTWKDTAERLGAAVFEIPLAPTSVPGLRLHNTLLAMVKQVGVRVISGSRATGHTASQGRIDSVDIAAAGAPIRVWADEVILATGGFESQGLEVDSYGRMRETSFGLPVTGSAEVLEDCWADHPLLRAGLRVDAAMRPVDGDGNPVFENLRAVGGLLAGANRIAELSGDGIALASAWAAVHAQPAAAQSQTAGDRAAVADSALVPLRTAVDQCLKCTICEAHCPVMAVTPLFPGPKFIGPQAERFRNPDVCEPESVSFCSGCGTCTLVCPQGVPVAALNSRAKARYKTSGGMPLRDRLIGRTTLMGQVMTPIAPLANAALANGPLRSLLERAIGVHRDAPMPPAQSRTFGSWWHNHKPQTSASRGQVVFFHGCAGGYFEVETSIRTVEVLERLGYEVLVPKQGCCGLAMQSNGLFDQASQAVRTLAGQLTAIPDVPIISASGSCTGMLKHEAREIMGVTAPEVTAVGNRVRDVMQFLRDVHETGGLPRLSRIDLRVLYHAPCQVKNQGMGLPALDVLRLIPGLEVAESNATCCGIAGTYGMKAELYDIAQAVGQPLFDQAQGFDLVACDTETCRWQIRKAARKPVEHPISLVHQALGG
ncbi:MAG: anaerobic glycerol-3-phosphate dehydrogenase subunit C [Propionibacteriaceae bacterium]|nr:anaerobic glycerol-3-phosphate dehydrogenase subunit C [Propionibacteriaceae bacterium]